MVKDLGVPEGSLGEGACSVLAHSEDIVDLLDACVDEDLDQSEGFRSVDAEGSKWVSGCCGGCCGGCSLILRFIETVVGLVLEVLG